MSARLGVLLLTVVVPALARAQAAGGAEPADAGVAEPSLSSELDAAAAAAPAQARPSAPAPTNPLVRAFQSLNPDISVIIDATAGGESKPAYSYAGDDPLLHGPFIGGDLPAAGATVQEAEVAFQAVVDPFFRADLYLTIPNLDAVEVEEAVITTTSLPANLQVKAGIFRSAMGRQNGQHLHLQDFTRRPLINEAYLGVDGLRSPGAQVSWLIPTPFFLQLSGEVLTVAPPDSTSHLTTFGGGSRTDLTYTAELKTFVPATDSLSIYAGLNAATGVSPGGGGAPSGTRSFLEGVDLYVKYKPPNVAGSYFSLAWTTEYWVRQITASTAGDPPLIDGGLYTQLVAQVARSWFIGVREDLIGLPSSVAQPIVTRTALSVTYVFSEFARLRAYAEREARPNPAAPLGNNGGFFGGDPTWAGYLQLEVSIGAHGAHPF